MRAPAILRAASAAAAIQGSAHGLLVWRYTPKRAAEVAVVDAMQSNHFSFMGASRSYWDFYFGYAMMGAFTCIVEAVLFWQLARVARTNPGAVVPIAAAFVLFNIGHALLAARFFMPTPIVFDLLVAALLGAAMAASTSSAGDGHKVTVYLG